MALTYRGASATPTNSAGTTTASPTLPASWANNEVAFLVITRSADEAPTGGTTGWNLICSFGDGGRRFMLYSRLLQTGDTAPSFTFATSAYTRACVYCYYAGAAGDLDTSSQTAWILASSNTSYMTNDTNCVAASVNQTEAATLVQIGVAYTSLTTTFTAPTSPGNFTEDSDAGHTTGRGWFSVNHYYNSTTGNTGDVTSTLNTARIVKHAWLVAVKKAAAASGRPEMTTMSKMWG
jgi:hypothetical protein